MKTWRIFEIVDELETLNTNLEALTLLLEKYQEVPEVFKDIRQMAADLLGWKVVEGKDTEEEEKL